MIDAACQPGCEPCRTCVGRIEALTEQRDEACALLGRVYSLACRLEYAAAAAGARELENRIAELRTLCADYAGYKPEAAA